MRHPSAMVKCKTLTFQTKSQAASITICLGVVTLLLGQAPASNGLWFTDGSLFRQPVEPLADETFTSGQQQTIATTTTTASKATSTSSLKPQESLPDASKSTLNSSTSQTDAAAIWVPSANRDPIEAWVQLVNSETSNELPAASPGHSRKQELQGTGNILVNGPALCQCNSDWLQNQTNFWLNKWTSSAKFANQMRTLLAAAGPQAKSGAAGGQSINSGNNRLGGSSAWNRPTGVGRRNGGQQPQSNARAEAQIGKSSGSTTNAHRASASSPNRWHHQTNNNQAHLNSNSNSNNNNKNNNSHQPAQVKLVQGERGPKGDQGARGERGPSGLISVKDRDALFDLAPASEGVDEHSATVSSRRLVFVNSEQLLVMETSSGWRPIPMLEPLHDFRKTIAKFNLNSVEERRKLMMQELKEEAAEQSGSVSPTKIKSRLALQLEPRLAVNSSLSTASGGQDKLLKSNSILGVIDAVNDEDDNDDDKDQEDDKDGGDDDDDDDDDDADESDDLNLEDDDDEDDDGDKDADGDEEDEQMANAINSKVAKMIDPLAGNKIATTGSSSGGSSKTKRGRAQVSSRSAMSLAISQEAGSTPKAAKLDNDQEEHKQLQPDESDNEDENGSGGRSNSMKLRLVALNEPFSGNQHGLRGANFECKRHAARAGVKGAFRAFLATNYQNLNEIVRYNLHVQKYPVVNLRGETLASSWHDLFRAPARMANPLSRIYSFDGRHVASDSNWPNKLVWLGTGSKFGHRDGSAAHNCDGWHSESLQKVGFATPLHSPKGHHQQQHQSSNNHNSQQQQHQSNKKRRQQRRFATTNTTEQTKASSTQRNTTTATASLVFDVIDKYPCRMPLIVLCIETVAQAE